MPRVTARLLNRLPAWTRTDHPIVARELERLPYLSLGRNSLVWRVLVGLMALLTPCALFFGNIPIQILLLPLSFLALNWSAPLLGTELSGGTWEALRLTPYSTMEIVLAKLSAVGHRLRSLLGLLEAGQVASLMALLLFMVMFNPYTGYRAMSGAWIRQITPPTPVAQSSMLIAGLGIMVVSLLIPAVDFGLTIVLGALASTWARRQETALVWAVLLRALVLGLFLVVGFLLLQAATGEAVNPLMVFAGALLGGPVGWTFLGLYDWPWAALATGAILLLGEVLALLVALWITIKRAERLQ